MPEVVEDLSDLMARNEWEIVKDRLESWPRVEQEAFARQQIHTLCSSGSTPAFILDLIACFYPAAVHLPEGQYGDTPLHRVCRNSQVSADKVRVLLKYATPDGLLLRNVFGGTALHSACNQNATLEALELMLRANPQLARATTREGLYPVAALWSSFLQTIPGYMAVSTVIRHADQHGIASDGHSFLRSNDGLQRFWDKLVYVSTAAFAQTAACPTDVATTERRLEQYVLHALLQCNVEYNTFLFALHVVPARYAAVPDASGNLPLHGLLGARPFRLREGHAVQQLTAKYPAAASVLNDDFDTPLSIALHHKMPWTGSGLAHLISPRALEHIDRDTQLRPFLLAASIGGKSLQTVERVFCLLRARPDLLRT